MAFRPRRQRRARRARRAVGRRPARRSARMLGKGSLVLKRKAELAYIQNTATAGVPTTYGITNSMITLGTPEGSTLNGNYAHVPFSCQFSLNQVIASSDITNLADRYRIKSVNLKIRYNTNQYTAPVNSTLNGAQPAIYYITDHDDAAVNTVSQLRQKMGLKSKVFNSNRPVSLSVAPRVAQNVYNGATAAFLVPSKSVFINSMYNDVPHYGIKGYIENMCLETVSNLHSSFVIDATFTIEAKDFQ